MGGFSEYRRKKAEMLSAAKRLRVDVVVKETLGKPARVGRGAEDGTVASDRGLPTSGWQVSVTEPVAGKPKGLSRALVAGEPIVRKNERRKARSDRRKANGYGATEAPIDWDAADALPMHHSRSRGRSRGPDSSSGNAFPSCAALATGVALVMMVAVCALAIFAPADVQHASTTSAGLLRTTLAAFASVLVSAAMAVNQRSICSINWSTGRCSPPTATIMVSPVTGCWKRCASSGVIASSKTTP